jgi:hypothetical protein
VLGNGAGGQLGSGRGGSVALSDAQAELLVLELRREVASLRRQLAEYERASAIASGIDRRERLSLGGSTVGGAGASASFGSSMTGLGTSGLGGLGASLSASASVAGAAAAAAAQQMSRLVGDGLLAADGPAAPILTVPQEVRIQAHAPSKSGIFSASLGNSFGTRSQMRQSALLEQERRDPLLALQETKHEDDQGIDASFASGQWLNGSGDQLGDDTERDGMLSMSHLGRSLVANSTVNIESAALDAIQDNKEGPTRSSVTLSLSQQPAYVRASAMRKTSEPLIEIATQSIDFLDGVDRESGSEYCGGSPSAKDGSPTKLFESAVEELARSGLKVALSPLPSKRRHVPDALPPAFLDTVPEMAALVPDRAEIAALPQVGTLVPVQRTSLGASVRPSAMTGSSFSSSSSSSSSAAINASVGDLLRAAAADADAKLAMILEDTRFGYDKLIKEKSDAYEHEIATLRSQLEAAYSRCDGAEMRLSDMQGKADALQDQVGSLTHQLDDVQSSYGQKLKIYEARCQSADVAAAEARTTIHALQRECARLTEAERSKASLISDRESDVRLVAAEKNRLIAQHRALQERLTIAEKERTDAQADCIRMGVEVSQLHEALSEKTDLLEEKDTQLTAWRRQGEEMEKDVSSLRLQFSAAQYDRDNARTEAESLRTALAEARIADEVLQGKLREAEERSQSDGKTITSLQADVDAGKRRLLLLQEQLRSRQSENMVLQDQINSVSDRLMAFTSKLAEEETKRRQEESARRKEEEARRTSEMYNAAAKSEETAAKAELAATIRKLHEAESRLAGKEQSLHDLQAELVARTLAAAAREKELEAQNNALQLANESDAAQMAKEVERFAEEFTSLRLQVDDLHNVIRCLTEERDAARKAAAAGLRRGQQAEMEREAAQRDLVTLQSQISQLEDQAEDITRQFESSSSGRCGVAHVPNPIGESHLDRYTSRDNDLVAALSGSVRTTATASIQTSSSSPSSDETPDDVLRQLKRATSKADALQRRVDTLMATAQKATKTTRDATAVLRQERQSAALPQPMWSSEVISDKDISDALNTLHASESMPRTPAMKGEDIMWSPGFPSPPVSNSNAPVSAAAIPNKLSKSFVTTAVQVPQSPMPSLADFRQRKLSQ